MLFGYVFSFNIMYVCFLCKDYDVVLDTSILEVSTQVLVQEVSTQVSVQEVSTHSSI